MIFLEIMGSIILTIIAVFIITVIGFIIYGFVVTRHQTEDALRREFRKVNVIQDVYDARGGPEGFILDESMIDKGWIGLHLITNNKDLLIAHEILRFKPLIEYNQDVIYDLKKKKYKMRAHVE